MLPKTPTDHTDQQMRKINVVRHGFRTFTPGQSPPYHKTYGMDIHPQTITHWTLSGGECPGNDCPGVLGRVLGGRGLIIHWMNVQAVNVLEPFDKFNNETHLT